MIRESSICLFLLLFVAKSIFAENRPKVVIVGAGAAGIAAASKLLEHGDFDIEILEAEQRYGGRIHNLYVDNYYKALGAEGTIKNDDNIVYQMLKNADAINEKWTSKPGIYATSNGDALSFEQFQPYIDALKEVNEDFCRNITSEDEFYQKVFKSIPENKFDETLGRNLPKFMNISIHFPCEWDKTGQHLVKPLEGDDKRPVRGMMTVLDILMKAYPNTELPENYKKILKLGHKVTKIVWNQEKPEISIKRVDTKEESKITVDHVIVTVPMGVLKANQMTLFDPLLPEKHQKVINLFKISIENNMYLTFENRWWPTGYDLFVVWTKSDVKDLYQKDFWLSKIEGFVPVEDAPAVLAVHNMDLEYSSSENLADHEIIHKIMTLLKRAFGGRGWNITDPIKFDHSRWGTNPNFYGSFTYKDYEAVLANVTNSDLREDIKNEDGKVVMLLAGEATHDRFEGSVTGAIETGFEAANKLIKLYG